MSVYQNMNQFAQTPLKGSAALNTVANTVSVQVDPASVATIVAGDAVKLVDKVSTTIIVDKCANTDAVFGYVLYTPKKAKFVAGDALECAIAGSILYLEASGSIARGANIEFVASTSTVITAAGTNPVSGVALDKVSSGQLVRVHTKGVAALTSTFTGGTIDASPIGGSTPAAGAFTTLAASGASTLTGAVTMGDDLTVARNIVSTTATLTGAGAVPVTVDVVKLVTNAANALTLADGVDGQQIEIVMITDGGAGTLTPSNPAGFSTLTFDDVGDSARLRFLGTKWYIVGTPSATKA